MNRDTALNFLHSSGRRRAAFCGIIGLGLLLRFWGLDFGLPHREARPDESTVIYMALLTVKNGLAPSSLTYPTFYIYLLAGLYKFFGLFIGGTAELVRRFAVEPSALFMINRVLAALFGSFMIIPVYKTAKLLFGARAALASGLMAAVCLLLARDSHFGTLDIPAVFFVAFSTWFSVRACFSGRAADYALAGAAAGLATGTKYIGILMFFQLAAIQLALALHKKKPVKDMLKDPRPWYFALAFAAAFFISTPYAFLAPSQLRQDYAFHTSLHGVMRGSTLWHHLAFSLRHALTLPALALAAAGAALMTIKTPRKALMLGGFFLAYLAVLDKVSSVYIRYVLPLLPVLCICAGYALAKLTERAKTALPFALLAVLAAAAPLYYSVRQNIIMSRHDTRVTAEKYFSYIMPKGVSVGVLASQYSTPQLAWDNGYLSSRIREESAGPNPLMAQVYGYMVDRNLEKKSPGYRRIPFTPQGFTEPPDYIIIACGRFEARPCGLTARGYAKDYDTILALNPGEQAGAVYDPTDAFYLPLDGRTRFPGPGFLFLQRK
ncbi:MAG: glycosyltransferase family 39 protein [Elusimicrobiaceae bacterium]|nr:glycosyltransferase family 39 protein [Elusimicrobiaceae bacterium]